MLAGLPYVPHGIPWADREDESGEVREVRLRLRFGEKADQSTTMQAKSVLVRYGWPTGIENGVSFAGDDPFGGAAIVKKAVSYR
ncbi:hypothetical protein EJ357_33730 [Streptomyces cyaneochromogenes]|uniref:Uncharacterized protein n=1 Tax=Streptomyces cyaneochromogenes TaxID=2496836 RepID=A0A3Q9EXU6_9ACTN|nr:hypothetical protein [Streptomyces cyaneochromogenes]AZQ37810.1 hypothetical protein EJ357_33730 [Streptomyces cyaneochromogenes]